LSPAKKSEYANAAALCGGGISLYKWFNNASMKISAVTLRT
jgi:hypothetical protein